MADDTKISNASTQPLDVGDDIAAMQRGQHRDISSNPKKQSNVAELSREDKKRKRASESEEHKSQLAALKENDPEFYTYLLETDKDLLNFQTGDSESDEEEHIEASFDGLKNCLTRSKHCFSPDLLQSRSHSGLGHKQCLLHHKACTALSRCLLISEQNLQDFHLYLY